MVTPSDGPPFQVIFHQGTGRYEVLISLGEFHSVRELSDRSESIATLTENLPLRLQFIANDPRARLYMDGLECVPQERLQEDDDGRPFLSPGKLNLFSYDNYNWIPGLYRLEVMVGSGDRHYAQIQVLPKELSLAEWTTMRDELEQELRGLAWELARHQLGLRQYLAETLPPDLVHRFMLVQRFFPRVMAALADLDVNINHRVKKVQIEVPARRARLGHPALGRQKSASKVVMSLTRIDYDLPENRWVKRIIRTTESNLRRFLVAVHSYLATLEAERLLQEPYCFQSNVRQTQLERQQLSETIQRYQLAGEKMLLGLQLLRQATWYDQVGVEAKGWLPQALQTDGRYHALYQLFRQLKQDDWQPPIDQSYQYQWKRTDRLYEIWCVIQLCRVLIALGFSPVSGWLYDSAFSDEFTLVPDLPAGTCLTFVQGPTCLRLAYDQAMPRQSSETSLPQQPVYTQDVHNRPDLRLDFYQQDVFTGCLVIDCKYRPLRGFWKSETLITGYDRPKAMSQLISYGMAVRSRYLYGQRPDWAEHRAQVVLEVWALHPGAQGEAEELYAADHRMRILCLRPGLSTALLAQRLNECLARV